MNIFLESKPNCIATLRVELEPERVEKEWVAVSRQFQKQARIPGFRPGKAPQALIDKKFGSDIREELQSKLLRAALNEAIEEKKLSVLSVTKVDHVDIRDDKSMEFTATLVTSPEFELPEYKGLPVEAEKALVDDSKIDEALQSIAEQHASFTAADPRPAVMDDFAVMTYEASIDGAPLATALPDAPKLLAGRPNWWVHLTENALAPGFSAAVIGMNPDEVREFDLTLPDDFGFEPLRGKVLHYTVTLHEIRVREMPELDDEFAASVQPDKSLAELREMIREELEKQSDRSFSQAKRNGVLNHLVKAVTCDLPTDIVNNEMQGILNEIVEENQGRGMSDEELKAQENEILGFAKQSAGDRVRSRFILLRIAEKEDLKVDDRDMTMYVMQMAAQYQVPVQKLVKDLRKRDAFRQIQEQLLVTKALEFVVENATVSTPVSADTVPA